MANLNRATEDAKKEMRDKYRNQLANGANVMKLANA